MPEGPVVDLPRAEGIANSADALPGRDFDDGLRRDSTGSQSIHLKLVDRKDPSIDFVVEEEHLHLYFTTDDVDGDAATLQRNGVPLREAVANTPWGTREFSILDSQGHLLRFGQAAR